MSAVDRSLTDVNALRRQALAESRARIQARESGAVQGYADCPNCKGATPPPGCSCKAKCGNTSKARHECHAKGCAVEVPPKMFMCARHWRMVPRQMQRAIWAAYVPGQEERKDPSARYLDVAREAIEAVAAKDGAP